MQKDVGEQRRDDFPCGTPSLAAQHRSRSTQPALINFHSRAWNR
jgi:hypothetical protein